MIPAASACVLSFAKSQCADCSNSRVRCGSQDSSALPLTGENGISIRVSILASGSSGNCTLLETSRTRLLVDAGLGKKETLRRLTLIEQSTGHVDGIVISHEHSDHIGGLLALAGGEWRNLTIYLTPATHAEIVSALPERRQKRLQRVEFIKAGQRFAVGDIEVAPFAIPHDAADPLGFTFSSGGVKVGIVTDLGYLPELVKIHIRDCDALLLESNHDLEMLKVGPYPWHIKQRVMSRTGHLSNDCVSEFLADPEGFDGKPRYLVLAHLSENNNNPVVARISAEVALDRRRDSSTPFLGQLMLAEQHQPLLPIQL
jgi:phosphoribosyl 1,2-cyclic phosphodiesterase